MKNTMTCYSASSLRWFFLAWLSIAYLWGLFLELGKTTSICTQQIEGKCLAESQVPDVNIPTTILFTLLILFAGGFIWAILAKPWKTYVIWSTFLLQGALVTSIGFLFPGEGTGITLNLFLALTLLASILFQQTRTVACVVGVYFALWLVIVANAISPKGQSVTWIDIIQLIPLYVTPLLFGIGYLLLYTQLSRFHTRLETTHQELAASMKRIETLTVLTERQRMARELHDTLAQGLTGVMLLVQGAHLHLTQHHYQQAEQVMQQTMHSARDTLTSARAAIDDLRCTTTDTTRFPEIVQEVLEHFSNATGISCKTWSLDLLALLPEPIFEHVRYSISEALTNIARHACACEVAVRMTRQTQQLLIEIEDDGIGFDLATASRQIGHYGLLGLRERARLIGGQIEINSAYNQGTCIRLQIPLGDSLQAIAQARTQEKIHGK